MGVEKNQARIKKTPHKATFFSFFIATKA